MKVKHNLKIMHGFEELYRLQLKLAKKIELEKGYPIHSAMLKGPYGHVEFQMVFEHLLACIHNELEECREWTSWKPWKTYIHDYNLKHLKELQYEVIDILHFWLELAMLVNLNPAEAMSLYLNKNKQNHQRQQKGY